MKATVRVVNAALNDAGTPLEAGPVKDFVRRVVINGRLGMHVLLVALLYIKRAGPHLDFYEVEWAAQRVFLGAVIVATKVCSLFWRTANVLTTFFTVHQRRGTPRQILARGRWGFLCISQKLRRAQNRAGVPSSPQLETRFHQKGH